MNNKPLARRLFHSLWRDSFYPGRYNVCNDLNYYGHFYAVNDGDAINRFLSGDYMEGPNE